MEVILPMDHYQYEASYNHEIFITQQGNHLHSGHSRNSIQNIPSLSSKSQAGYFFNFETHNDDFKSGCCGKNSFSRESCNIF